MIEDNPNTDAAPVALGWLKRTNLQALVLWLTTALGIYLCYRLVLPFFPALAWALALAILFSPFHRWVESRMKRANLAASVTVLVVALIVAVPAIFLGQRLLGESARGAEIIKTKVQSGEWRQAIQAQPRFAPLAQWIEHHVDLPGTVNALTKPLTTTAGTLLKGSVVQMIGFIFTFYLLFYFLRDRRMVLQSLKSCVHLFL
jgi:predicted PurR-regulated permease PerM